MINHSPSLLIFSGVQGDSRRYRTFHLYEQACLANLNCQLTHVTDPAIKEKTKGSNIVFIHRAAYDGLIAWISEETRRKDGIVIFDVDDLVFELNAVKFIDSPDFADPVRLSLYQDNIRLTRKTLDVSNFVTVADNYLMHRVRQLGKQVYVHRNAFSMEMLSYAEKAYQIRETNQGGIVIGYASGTPTHDQDFIMIKPALQSVLNRHPEAKLILIGQLDPGKDWGDLEGRIERIKRQPWTKLPEIQVHFDINLAPLQIDNPFGQSKSEIKYMEAALVRVPTVASPSDVFRYAIRHGENGFLAGNTQEWEEILESLIAQPKLRRRIGKQAFDDVQLRYHPKVRARELIGILEALLNEELALPANDQQPAHAYTGSLPKDWDSASLDRTPTLLQRGIYTLRYRNLLTLIKQVWIYFRRLVVPVFPYRSRY